MTRSSSALRVRMYAAIVLVMLALPALYYVVSAAPSKPVHASVAAQSPASQMSALETLAQTQPTLDNRVNLSLAYIQAGMYGRAIELLDRLSPAYPGSATVWNNLCVAHTLQGELNLAIDACNTGIRVDGNFPLLRNNLRWAESERDKTLAALARQEGTAPGERDARFYMEEGLNLLHLGNYEQAIAAWKRVLDQDPRSSVAVNNIGTAQMMLHRYGEAEGSFRRALALEPGSQLAQNNLAWATSTEAAAKIQPAAR